MGRGKSVLTFHSGGYALEHAATATKLSRDAFIFRAFDRVIGVNPLMLEMFTKFGVAAHRRRADLSVRSPTTEPTVTVPGKLTAFAAQHSPFLLAVCLLEPDYDLPTPINAMRTVLEEHPNAGLMIVGSGSLEAVINEEISLKPYRERILLAGDVEHRHTLHLIERADALLRTTRFDGDAISIREALFLGTPVVATDNGMRPEGVELIPVGDPGALAAAISKVLARPKSGGEKLPEDRSNIAAVLDLYDELVNAA